MKFWEQNSYGNFMTSKNHKIHNLGIQELHLGIARILTILVQPKPSIENIFIRRKGGGFFPNMGHVSVMNPKQVCD
jgi:hypothetical protein